MKVNNIYRNIMLAIIPIFMNSSLAAASFDCRNASIVVEYMICENQELSRADEQMARAYYQLLNILPRSEQSLLKEGQREWLKERNLELPHCTLPGCEINFYELRIQQLDPVEQVSFNCGKASTPVEKKVCHSRLLQHADGRMAKVYKPLRHELKQDQHQWLIERNERLSQSYCDTSCAWQFYKDRIEFFVRYGVND
ncbi:MAG: hypothetical protein DRQ49_08740 [Gammaproteobacteria bacterium]|nr:MAG: hypothetical protein DRQ49_08740 [Gammaproteobacteria bacterium]RKZ44413.1 MAG: hypothetical protein DRQ41_02870 [Gammaproteobacteria bacterium]RKZ74649.1 MAG: hypothetical protein DRQ57_10280 [Gammaproteobacteria bacterium]